MGDKPKYSKYFHQSLNNNLLDELEKLEEKAQALKKKAREDFPFKEGERVAIMDTSTKKFKGFAFLTRLDHGIGYTPYYVRYQKETKTGKKEKTIMTLYSNEFMVPAEEADPADKLPEWVPPVDLRL